MQSQETDVHAMYRALGASPVPIAVTEVLSSLQTGDVDGYGQTPLLPWPRPVPGGQALHPVRTHLPTRRRGGEQEVVDRLRPSDQAALTAGAAQEAAEAVAMCDLGLLLENFKAAKVAIHKLTPAQRAAL